MKVFSYGGGWQSNAALVLAARGELDADAFLFANVGDDSERVATLRYVREIAMPYARAHGIALHELSRPNGETLYGRVMAGKRGVVIPAMLHGAGALPRQCTGDFKIAVIHRWLREHGARSNRPATDMLGISLDEYQRMRTDSGVKYVKLAYPLIDRRITRQRCAEIILSEGLPLPPKSACWFCPFHTLGQWQELAHEDPSQFAMAVDLERHINDTSTFRKRLYLYRGHKPLRQVISLDTAQGRMFDDANDVCESGYCMV